MDCIKKNIKLIIGIIIGMIIASGIAVYATYTYMATDVKYTDDKSVAQCLEELYASIPNIRLSASGSVEYSSSQTTETKINCTLESNSTLVQNNNVITINKSGKYLIFIAAGSNEGADKGTSFSAITKLYINNSLIKQVAQAWANYRTDYYIADLDKNDTLYFTYVGGGDNYAKRSQVYIFEL